jgi:hypothetical protein
MLYNLGVRRPAHDENNNDDNKKRLMDGYMGPVDLNKHEYVNDVSVIHLL